MNQYRTETDIRNNIKLERVIKNLPDHSLDYFVSLQNRSLATTTQLGYAYEISLFYDYLLTLKKYKGYDKTTFPLELLDDVEKRDIERYIAKKTEVKSDEGKSRVLATLRSYFGYFNKNGDIKGNPAAIVDTPKLHKKNIVTMDADDIQRLLQAVERPPKTDDKKALKAHEKTVERDKAIITLLLGTGLRISELVGLNLSDIDWEKRSINIVQKGGNEDVSYFDKEVANTLAEYIEVGRPKLRPPEDENAVFLSTQHKRMTVRAIEIRIKKFAKEAGLSSKITPHKCRSSYGTFIYEETHDVYAVKDALHHASLETSKKYIGNGTERQRKAAIVAQGLFKKD